MIKLNFGHNLLLNMLCPFFVKVDMKSFCTTLYFFDKMFSKRILF